MPCYKPLLAWQQGNGDIVFVERIGKDVRRELQLPCGRCIGCRLDRAKTWAIRCVHESSLYKQNAFVTLTYSAENMPHRGMLQYRDYQLFMKRLRKQKGEGIRFYMCGEYGPLNWRPHYHACLFNCDFEDKKPYGVASDGSGLYRSDELERLWPHGFATVGDVTYESAGYVARYCVQKRVGQDAKWWYSRVDRDGSYRLPAEFNKMSNRPGIGAGFFSKWTSDIYPHDYIVLNGTKVKTPRYYDKLFKRLDRDTWEDLQMTREAKGRAHWEDNTQERLNVKEIVTKARADMLKRVMYDYDV